MIFTYQPIESAPKTGGMIYVTDRINGEMLASWNPKKCVWEGEYYTCMCKVKIYWDETEPPISHWRPA